MLPFTEAFVPRVDVAGGRIVVAPAAEVAGGAGSGEDEE